MAFTEINDISKPAGSRDKSLGDDDIREGKRVEIERQAVDHDRRDDEAGAEKTVSPDGTIGYHKKCTLIVRDSDEAAVANANVLYTKDVNNKAEPHIIDEDGNVVQLLTAGKLNTAVLKADEAATVALITQFVYPVGSIYINAGVATNPATLFGFGTWVAFGAGKVLVSVNTEDSDFNTVEKTGGAKTVNTSDHDHEITRAWPSTSTNGVAEELVVGRTGLNQISDGFRPSETKDTNAKGAESLSIVQPYITVYMWKRTA